MAKFLPVIGEIFTAVESTAKLVGAGVVAPFDGEKSKKLLRGAGDAWVDYANHNGIALAVQGRGKDLGKEAVGFAEGTPAVGHAIGVGRYIAGDKEGGDRCMKQASRTTAVIGAVVLTGGAGAVVGGVAAVGAGLATDALTTGVDSAVHGEYRPAGVVAGVTEAVKTGDPNKIVDAALIPVADFTAGAIAGRSAAAGAAEADAALPRVQSAPAVMGADAVADAGAAGIRPRAVSAPGNIGQSGPGRGAVRRAVPIAIAEADAEAEAGARIEPRRKQGEPLVYEHPDHPGAVVLSEYGIANPPFTATWEPHGRILTLYMEEGQLQEFEQAMKNYRGDAEVIQPGSFPAGHRNVHNYRNREIPQGADVHTHVKIRADDQLVEATVRQVLHLALGDQFVGIIDSFIQALLCSFAESE